MQRRLHAPVLIPITLTLVAANLSLGQTQAWFPFAPAPDSFHESPIDLRFLNERFAGEHGFIAVTNGQFIHSATGQPERFWGVNGPPQELHGEALRPCARMLAKHGVNLARIHGGYFDAAGEVDLSKVRHALEIVQALKAEGIYTHFSIYFPLWITAKPDNRFLKGYDGKTHPFAALFFNPDFQAQYRKWWTALLTTPDPATGKRLIEEPAVASLELQNEDSFFFWTFSEKNIPDPQLRLLEKMFGDWAAKRYGTASAALAKWNLKLNRDAPEEGRLGFRPLWNMFNEKTLRDRDTARFLFETQEDFYRGTVAFLRRLGFKGPITASNWITASPEVFGPIEKLSYCDAGDFIDRHGYFSCNHKGDSAEWSIRNGQTYSERSALRFDPEEPGKGKQFVHPAMDPHYNDKPSMLSETTWNRPNRFRGEAPLYLAAYGALQHSDAIVHFALDGKDWSVKPNFWMQPWTLMSPAMMGQFPAAALIFRRGLIASGEVLAHVYLNHDDLLGLKGTPLPQDAALDELRLKDVMAGDKLKPGMRIDPLVHYAGRTEVEFGNSPASVKTGDWQRLIDHTAQTVTSSTGELKLDYGKGILRINATRVQGASGALRAAGKIDLKTLSITSTMDPGHIIAVSLDDRPLETSKKILLQVMSEEKASGFQTEPVSEGVQRITNIGTDPWMVRNLEGTIRFLRPDAAQLSVRSLDFSGYPGAAIGSPTEIKLQPRTIYYLIEPASTQK